LKNINLEQTQNLYSYSDKILLTYKETPTPFWGNRCFSFDGTQEALGTSLPFDRHEKKEEAFGNLWLQVLFLFNMYNIYNIENIFLRDLS